MRLKEAKALVELINAGKMAGAHGGRTAIEIEWTGISVVWHTADGWRSVRDATALGYCEACSKLEVFDPAMVMPFGAGNPA